MSHYVYFGFNGLHYKIGHTKNLYNRIKTIRMNNVGFGMVVAFQTLGDVCYSGQKPFTYCGKTICIYNNDSNSPISMLDCHKCLEYFLKKTFEREKVEGEWFHGPNISRFVKHASSFGRYFLIEDCIKPNERAYNSPLCQVFNWNLRAEEMCEAFEKATLILKGDPDYKFCNEPE